MAIRFIEYDTPRTSADLDELKNISIAATDGKGIAVDTQTPFKFNGRDWTIHTWKSEHDGSTVAIVSYKSKGRDELAGIVHMFEPKLYLITRQELETGETEYQLHGVVVYDFPYPNK